MICRCLNNIIGPSVALTPTPQLAPPVFFLLAGLGHLRPDSTRGIDQIGENVPCKALRRTVDLSLQHAPCFQMATYLLEETFY